MKWVTSIKVPIFSHGRYLLGQLPGKKEPHGSLDLPRGDGQLVVLVVAASAQYLSQADLSHLLELTQSTFQINFYSLKGKENDPQFKEGVG